MIILVTGATAGFGESITRRFVANGHKVIATGRRQERLQVLKEELGDSVLTVQLDVRNRAAIEEALSQLPAEWQAIDILVNNAGLALGIEPAHKASVEDDAPRDKCAHFREINGIATALHYLQKNYSPAALSFL